MSRTHPFDPSVERVAYTPAEAAYALGCTRKHIYTLITSGALRSTSLGRARRIPRTEVERLAGLTPPASNQSDVSSSAADMARASRAAQGLTPTVDDAAAQRIAALLRGGDAE